MPIVLKIGGLRFYFYSNEHEPPHVHVSFGKGAPGSSAKIEILSLKVLSKGSFNDKQLNKIASFVQLYRDHLIDTWEDYFGEEG